MSITVRLFAALRDRRGTDRVELEPTPNDSPRSLFQQLFEDRPSNDWPGPMMFAVNQEYVDGDHPVQDGDEVAFIPPLGGGSSDPRVHLTDQVLELAPLVELVSGAGRGGICTFTGTVRDHFEGRPVTHLEYEAYAPMALQEMSRLCDEIETRWDGVRVAISHRVGRLAIGEAAVHVVAAGGHRAETFEACRHGIDRLKETVPIFKKEVYADGSTWKADGGA